VPAPNASEAIGDESLAISLLFTPILRGSFGHSFGAVIQVARNGVGGGHLAGRGFGHFGSVLPRPQGGSPGARYTHSVL
jgi:hypothetical protein